MNRIIKYIISDVTCAARELAGLTVIILSFIAAAWVFLRQPLATAIAVYDSGSFSLPAALGWNLATPYALITVPFLALIFYLPIRFFAVDRAHTFGIDTTRKNYLAAVRDYTSVLLVTFVACASVWPSLSGGYFIPVATLTGIVLAWWTYSIIVNFAGYGEAMRDTVRDLAAVMVLLLIGKIIPAVFRGFTYSSIFEYFMEIGIIYAMGAGIGIITYPGKGIDIPLSRNRAVAHLQSYAIALFAYFGGIFIALLPVFILLVLVVAVLLAAMVFFAATGSFGEIGEFSSSLFFSVILPRGKGLFLVALYSPVLYIIAFFKSMIMAAMNHWTGAVELVAFLSSLHYSLWKYRKRL